MKSTHPQRILLFALRLLLSWYCNYFYTKVVATLDAIVIPALF